MNRDKYNQLFWILLIGVTLFKLIIAGSFGLSVDESHYLMYARNPAFGYLDHPPMVGFLGAATTLFSESIWFVRLGPIICAFLSVIVLRAFVIDLYRDDRVAAVSYILLLCMPVYHLLSVALLPDATLNLFWSFALLAFWRALNEDQWKWWLLGGASFGFALMSKYHGVLLPLCLAGYVLTSAKHRHHVLSVKPWCAGLTGLLVFMPNVIWNWSNSWVSYAFQLNHGGGSGYFSFSKLFESIGGQMGAASPIIFILLIAASLHLIFNYLHRDNDLFALWMSLPVFIFFCGIGLFGKILPHWPFVGWWAGAPLIASVFLRRSDMGGRTAIRWGKWIKAGYIVGIILVLFLHVSLIFPVIEPLYNTARSISIALNSRISWVKPMEEFKPKYDPSNDLFGWDQAAAAVEQVIDQMPDPDRTFIFSHRFFTVSQLAPELSREIPVTSLNARPSQYMLWFKAADYKGWDAVFIYHDRYKKASRRYAPLFERVEEEVIDIDVMRGESRARTVHLYKCYGFKGTYEGE